MASKCARRPSRRWFPAASPSACRRDRAGRSRADGTTFTLFADEDAANNSTFNPTMKFVLLFDQSVRGLVEIGTRRIPRHPDRPRRGYFLRLPEGGRRPEHSGAGRNRSLADAAEAADGIIQADPEFLAGEVKRGLRASLKIGSLLTGALVCGSRLLQGPGARRARAKSAISHDSDDFLRLRPAGNQVHRHSRQDPGAADRRYHEKNRRRRGRSCDHRGGKPQGPQGDPGSHRLAAQDARFSGVPRSARRSAELPSPPSKNPSPASVRKGRSKATCCAPSTNSAPPCAP